MGLGIGVGFEKAMDSVARDMQNAIPTSFEMPGVEFESKIPNRSRKNSGGNTAITQNISVVTPKALSEKEIAREFKNMSRKLALEY